MPLALLASLPWKYICIALAVAGLVFGIWHAGVTHERAKWEKAIAAQKAEAKAMLDSETAKVQSLEAAAATLNTTLEKAHADEAVSIAAADRSLTDARARWMREHPGCRGGGQAANGALGGAGDAANHSAGGATSSVRADAVTVTLAAAGSSAGVAPSRTIDAFSNAGNGVIVRPPISYAVNAVIPAMHQPSSSVSVAGGRARTRRARSLALGSVIRREV